MSYTTKEEREMVDRFKAAFNRIHDFMHTTLNESNKPFGVLLNNMLEKHLIKNKDYTFLNACRELRNFVVHNKNLYMAIPSIQVVEKIERLANRYADVPTVNREFSDGVQTLRSSDTMIDVMKIIEETAYTQFPVYDDQDNFVNLLTENVITLWLAKHVVRNREVGSTDLSDTVADALKLHDDEEHWEFIPRHMTIAAATALFAEKPVLEVLIITEHGKVTETPVGIVTRSDALDMLDGKRDTQRRRKVQTDS